MQTSSEASLVVVSGELTLFEDGITVGVVSSGLVVVSALAVLASVAVLPPGANVVDGMLVVLATVVVESTFDSDVEFSVDATVAFVGNIVTALVGAQHDVVTTETTASIPKALILRQGPRG